MATIYGPIIRVMCRAQQSALPINPCSPLNDDAYNAKTGAHQKLGCFYHFVQKFLSQIPEWHNIITSRATCPQQSTHINYIRQLRSACATAFFCRLHSKRQQPQLVLHPRLPNYHVTRGALVKYTIKQIFMRIGDEKKNRVCLDKLSRKHAKEPKLRWIITLLI